MKTRTMKSLVVLMFAGGSAGIGAVATTALGTTFMTATASAQANTHCDNDSVDNGKGNFGDPGDGGNHHNEDVGQGNHGDPGNGGNHDCTG